MQLVLPDVDLDADVGAERLTAGAAELPLKRRDYVCRDAPVVDTAGHHDGNAMGELPPALDAVEPVQELVDRHQLARSHLSPPRLFDPVDGGSTAA